MLNRYTFQGKSYEEALEKCLESLSCTEKDLYITTTEQEAKLFKAKKIELSVIKKDDVISYIKDFLKQIGVLMNLELNMEVKEKEEIIEIILVSSENSILIGKEGRTLNAIQLLLRQSLQKQAGFLIKVNLDASNYKVKRLNNLERQIKRVAQEVQESKIDAKLDPMNSFERRFVHNFINQYEDLETESVGVSPNRCVVIKYVEK